MALTFDHKEYSPSDLAKVLSEKYGHKVTPSVVRKWDNMVFSSIVDKKRIKDKARTYNNEDLLIFNAIATLRDLGYPLEDVKSILRATHRVTDSSIKPDFVFDMGTEKIVMEVKHNISKRKEGYEMAEQYLKMLKERK